MSQQSQTRLGRRNVPSKPFSAGLLGHKRNSRPYCQFCPAEMAEGQAGLVDVGDELPVRVCESEDCRRQALALRKQPATTKNETGESARKAGRKPEVAMAERTNYSEIMTEERAAAWARLRREGKSYDAITNWDPLSPSLPTIKKYLREYGFAYDGHRMDGEAPADDTSSLATVDGTDLAPANGQDVQSQLAAVQKLMSTLQAGDVKVQGKIRVDLSIEVDVDA